jgi:peptidoglycan/xylan/chitin deacetylase (PgdA/CDA1 family)
VTEPPENWRDPYDRRHAYRRAEREERRLAVQRQRRIVAFGALAGALIVFVAIAIAVVGGGGGNDSPSSGEQASASSDKDTAKKTDTSTKPAATPPAKKVPRSQRNVPVPILMYHLINDPPPGAPLPDLYVAKADFAKQMKWLKDNGYTAVTQQQVYDLWKKGTALPTKKPVVVSFDDGFRSIRTNGFPVLKRLGWKGVVNLQGNIFEKGDEGGMSKQDVQGLVDAGWELDAHSVTHPDLTTLDDATLQQEVAGVRTQLKDQFKVPVNFFCYPAGRYDDRVVQAVKDAGYLGATTTQYGNAGKDQLMTMNRVRVNRTDGVEGFIGKMQDLEGAAAAPAPPSFGGGTASGE